MRKLRNIVMTLLLGITLFNPVMVFALDKSETVYINLGYDGKPSKTVVNSHLYINTKGDIKDETELQEILNINGDEKFILDKGLLTWKANNKDIFYRGVTEKLTPITVDIKYYLNEKEMSAKDIVGKKGSVKIKMSFKNNMYLKDKGMYTPFVVTAGTIISATDNQNIEVTNGKSINTGTKNMVVGVSAPGLYESMGIDEFKDFDEITISFDTKKFSLSNIYIVATPKLLEDTDLGIFDKMDELNSSIGTIQKNMDKIDEGAKALQDGSKQLVSGSTEISNNLETVLKALTEIQNGTGKLDDSLKQVVSSLELVQKQLNDKNIPGSIAELNGLKEKNDTVINMYKTYTTYGLNNFADEATLRGYFTAQGADEATIQKLIACKTAYETTYQMSETIMKLIEGNNVAVEKTITSLTDLSTQIDTLLNTLKGALKEIEAGENKVNQSLIQVKTGVDKLYKGSKVLVEGTKTLDNGVGTLSSGISTLNKQGINKLSSMTRKYKNYGDKVEELIELANAYNGFVSNNSNNTMFVYKVKSAK